jgi:hypothetical protein
MNDKKWLVVIPAIFFELYLLDTTLNNGQAC